MAEQVEKLLLKVSEVVKVTGYCRSVVYAMIASGEIPSIRRGRSIRVPAVALSHWTHCQVEQQGKKTNN